MNSLHTNNTVGATGRVAVSRTSLFLVIALITGTALPLQTAAQEHQEGGLSSTLLEEVVVTARKHEELAQAVPISIVAYNSAQLEALKIRDLSNLSVKMPNVALDDMGTFRTTANFSIRGL